jgi:hypothetical protein
MRPPRLLPRGKSRCTRCLQPCDPATLSAADGLCVECAQVEDWEVWEEAAAKKKVTAGVADQRGEAGRTEKAEGGEMTKTWAEEAAALTIDALRHWESREWTAQGLGMLRCYVTRELMIHVWDSRLRNPGVSDVHDHPFDFTSLVVAGRITNQKYEKYESGLTPDDSMNYKEVEIQCGVGNPSPPRDVILLRLGLPEVIRGGQSYSQRASKVHHSLAEDGTITLVSRKFTGDGETARVYYQTPEWVTAVPRPATREEVQAVVGGALKKWEEEGQ